MQERGQWGQAVRALRALCFQGAGLVGVWRICACLPRASSAPLLLCTSHAPHTYPHIHPRPHSRTNPPALTAACAAAPGRWRRLRPRRLCRRSARPAGGWRGSRRGCCGRAPACTSSSPTRAPTGRTAWQGGRQGSKGGGDVRRRGVGGGGRAWHGDTQALPWALHGRRRLRTGGTCQRPCAARLVSCAPPALSVHVRSPTPTPLTPGISSSYPCSLHAQTYPACVLAPPTSPQATRGSRAAAVCHRQRRRWPWCGAGQQLAWPRRSSGEGAEPVRTQSGSTHPHQHTMNKSTEGASPLSGTCGTHTHMRRPRRVTDSPQRHIPAIAAPMRCMQAVAVRGFGQRGSTHTTVAEAQATIAAQPPMTCSVTLCDMSVCNYLTSGGSAQRGLHYRVTPWPLLVDCVPDSNTNAHKMVLYCLACN